MNRNLLLSGIFSLLISFALGQQAFAAEKITITGTVQPVAFDENNKVTAVCIETKDGPYTVINNARGKKLHRRVGKDIKVTGIAGKDKDGNTAIVVKKYEIVQ
jgi:acylphosphatase